MKNISLEKVKPQIRIILEIALGIPAQDKD